MSGIPASISVLLSFRLTSGFIKHRNQNIYAHPSFNRSATHLLSGIRQHKKRKAKERMRLTVSHKRSALSRNLLEVEEPLPKQAAEPADPSTAHDRSGLSINLFPIPHSGTIEEMLEIRRPNFELHI